MSVLIIDERNTHFLPRSLLFFGRSTSSYFLSISRGESPVAWPTAKPRKRDALAEDMPINGFRHDHAETLGTPVCKSTYKLYARASRPGERRRSPLLTQLEIIVVVNPAPNTAGILRLSIFVSLIRKSTRELSKFSIKTHTHCKIGYLHLKLICTLYIARIKEMIVTRTDRK